MSVCRIITLALAITAIAVPAAAARPADTNASVAQAAAQAQHRQDLRSPDGADAARKPTPVAPGQPTWPVDPKPITPAHAVQSSGSDDGADWATIGLGIAGALLALGGIVSLTSPTRRLPRTRASV